MTTYFANPRPLIRLKVVPRLPITVLPSAIIATKADVIAGTNATKVVPPVYASQVLRRAGFIDIKGEGIVGDGSDETAAIQAVLDNAAADKIPYVAVPANYVLGISSTLKFGNGSISQMSDRLCTQLIGQGAFRDRALHFGFARASSRLKWLGAAGGTMVEVAGPTVGHGISNFRLDGNNTAANAVKILSGQGSTFKNVMLGNCTGTLMELNVQQIPDGLTAPTEGYASHNTTENFFEHIYFDGWEAVQGNAVTCLKLDGWTNTGPGGTYDPCKNVFRDLRFSVDLANNASILDTCPDFINGRAGIAIDLRRCDSISFQDVWMQGIGTSTGTATSVIFRGILGGPVDAGGYPGNITFFGKYQQGQHLKTRVDESGGYLGGNIFFPPQEVDGESLGSTRLMRYVQGFKPESVLHENVQHHMAEYGYLRIRDEERNAVLNSGFLLATRGTSFTNPTNGQKLFDGGYRLEYNGTQSTVVSRQDFTLGQTAVAWEPRHYLRIATSAASGASSNGAFFDVPDVTRFGGRKVNFSSWLRVASGTVNLQAVLAQLFGTGGSPSSAVSVTSADLNQTVTTTWKRFRWTFDMPSLSGKTLGTNNNSSVKVGIGLPTNTVFTLDMAEPQFELGEADSPWFRRTLAQEQLLCGSQLQLVPNPSGGFLGFATVISTTQAILTVRHSQPMRAVPSLVNSLSATIYLRDYANANQIAASSVAIDTADKEMTNILITTGSAHGYTLGQMCRVISNTADSLLLSAEI